MTHLSPRCLSASEEEEMGEGQGALSTGEVRKILNCKKIALLQWIPRAGVFIND